MRWNLTLSRKAIILVSVPLIFELAFVSSLVFLLQQAESAREKEAHAREVTNRLNFAMRLMIESGINSVVYNLSGSRDARKRYRQAVERFPKEIERLVLVVKGHPEEENSLLRMTSLYNLANQKLFEAHARLEAGDRLGAMKPYGTMHKAMTAIFEESDKMVERQQQIQAERKQAEALMREQVKWLIIAGVAFNILLAVGLVNYFNRGTTRRLDVLLDNTIRLGAGQSLNPALEGKDEIARLDRVFRQMAASLDEAIRKERAVVENAADVICSIDSEGKFSAINPAVQKILHYQPSELIGARLVQYVHEEDVEKTLAVISQSQNERDELVLDNRIRHKNGNYVDMLWSLHWSESERSTICVLHDITARKELERLKRDFVAMVSHDLRTPLTSIGGFFSLLQSGAYNELSESGKRSLSNVDATLNRLMSMVNDLLDIEKLESGRLNLNLAPVTVEGLIESTFEMLLPVAKEKQISLESRDPEQIEFPGDADRLTQVLVNLVANAIKFADRETAITVVANQSADKIRLEVRDVGRAVPDEMKTAIFDRFKQVSDEDAYNEKGTGLGLAICKAIVERHGGEIGVEDNVDVENGITIGSVFWFSLPKAAE